MARRPLPEHEIVIDVDGREYPGRYTFDGKTVRVSCGFGSQATHIGGHPPDVLARSLLRELVIKRHSN
jgi:hypothetical protein